MSATSGITKKDFLKSFTDSIVTTKAGGRLQARDFEIMRFILEQKFCSLEAIYFRFFDVRKTPSEPLPKNLWTTRQRMSKLRALGFIKTEKVLSSGRAQFLLTPFGWKILTTYSQDTIQIRPTKEIDFSMFEHDSRITMIRALTETKGKSGLWYSDKWLKSGALMIDGHKFNFFKDLRPDAFFMNSKGQKVALELEIARKSRSRLAEKIALFDDLIEENYREGQGRQDDGSRFGASSIGEKFRVVDKVWFIATKPVVARFLLKLIESKARNPLCFRVDSYDEIVPEIARQT